MFTTWYACFAALALAFAVAGCDGISDRRSSESIGFVKGTQVEPPGVLGRAPVFSEGCVDRDVYPAPEALARLEAGYADCLARARAWLGATPGAPPEAALTGALDGYEIFLKVWGGSSIGGQTISVECRAEVPGFAHECLHAIERRTGVDMGLH